MRRSHYILFRGGENLDLEPAYVGHYILTATPFFYSSALTSGSVSGPALKSNGGDCWMGQEYQE